MTVRALIIDDEALARRGLELRLQKYSDIDVVGFATGGRAAVEAIRKHRPDVVFLDIQMPGLDGFGVLMALPADIAPVVVFVTAYDQYAVQAFEAHALDYLLKPIDEQRFDVCIERIRRAQSERSASQQRGILIDFVSGLTGDSPAEVSAAVARGDPDGGNRYLKRLPVKEGRRTVRLDVDEIDWIDAAGDYMCIHAAGTTHVLRGTMKRLEASLNPKQFQRIHRSTIVNIERVEELRPHMNGEYFLTLQCGTELKLSRHYKSKLNLFLGERGL